MDVVISSVLAQDALVVADETPEKGPRLAIMKRTTRATREVSCV
jgi:hypothetical protein